MDASRECACSREIEHLKQLLQEHEKRNNMMFANIEKANTVRDRTEEHWRAAANEWRAAMDDRERQFVPRSIASILAIVSILSLLVGLWGIIR